MTVEQTPKKTIRPLWVVLGLAGACAACCALPIGMLLAGGATLAAAGVALSRNWDVIVCGVLMLIVLGAGWLWSWPRRPAPSCRADGACGCKERP